MRPTPYLTPMPLRGRVSRSQPKGLPVINMGFNELPYPPAPPVAAALAEASARVQSYGAPHNDALRAALAEFHGIEANQIICGNGSEELLDVIARAFVRPGDEVLIPEFGYIQFALTTHRNGGDLVKAAETNLTVDVDALLAAVTPRTRVVFLANPNNPTGTMVPVEDLARLARSLRPDIVLVLDLAYCEFAPDGHAEAVHQLVAQHDTVVVSRTFSKAYGLAGARVGWFHAPDWMVPVLYGARGMGTVNALAQAAALAALSAPDVVAQRTAEICAERDRVTATLSDIGFDPVPSHTNFLMVGIPGGTPDRTEALVEHLFDCGGIVVNRTRETGLERYFRVSISAREHNDLFLSCCAGFLGENT